MDRADGPFAVVPPDVVGPAAGANCQFGQAVEVSGAGDRLLDLAGDHRLSANVLRVDDGTLTGDRDRFLDRTDRHLGIHRGGEIRGELDAFPPKRAEAGQGEGNGVGAGAEVDDFVLAALVRDGTANLLDEGGAGGFHRDSREHGTRGVSHNACDGSDADGLAERERRKRYDSQHHREHQPRLFPCRHDRDLRCVLKSRPPGCRSGRDPHLIPVARRPGPLKPAKRVPARRRDQAPLAGGL